MISLDDIRGLAQLARLKLTSSEEESLQKDISSILEYVGQVSAVSAEGHAQSTPMLRNVMRADEPHTEGGLMLGKREALLAALPKREGDFDVVRKIIQKDE